MTTNQRIAQILIILGAMLFLLGLLSGFAIPLTTNMKLGVGAHMAGVTNATFLMLAGVVWHRLSLSDRRSKLTCYTLVYSTYCNWFFVSLAAFWGTKALAPVSAGGDAPAAAWQEWTVTIGLLSVAATIIYATVMMIGGFIRKLRDMENGTEPA